MKRSLTIFGVAIASQVFASGPATAQSGDPIAGERAFRQCTGCHAVDAERNSTGPHLVGISDRPAGSVEGFRYSDAMKESGIVWDIEALSAYLLDPRGTLPGTTMTVGLRRSEDLEDLLAFLQSL